MTPTSAPAPLARRRPFPVRRQPEQLSLLSALAACEAHPDLAEGLRPMVRTIRSMQAAHVARQRGERLESGVIEAVAVEVSERRAEVSL